MNPVIATFAGLQIAPGPLFFDGKKFGIKDSWKHTSHGISYGKNKGSTFFNYKEICRIDNRLPDGWRLPETAQMQKIITVDPIIRSGSIVNGNAGCHWAAVVLSLDISEKNPNLFGMLLFPDGETITGKELWGVDDITKVTKSMTSAQLDEYLAQGCVFLPGTSSAVFDNIYGDRIYWGDNYNKGLYWTKQTNKQDSTYLFFTEKSMGICQVNNIDFYFPVRCVRYFL